MNLTMECAECGESIAFEYGVGDRSGVCWREACIRRRKERAERAADIQATCSNCGLVKYEKTFQRDRCPCCALSHIWKGAADDDPKWAENQNHYEHDFAHRFGFYRRQLWWIDTITIRHGNYYRYIIAGRNDKRGGESIHWTIPNLAGDSFAFALKEIPACSA